MTRGILLALLLLSAHGLAGCDGKPAAGAAPPPPSVTVARPLQKTITEWDEYTGRFAAVEWPTCTAFLRSRWVVSAARSSA
jgi:multidrug efflux system membrane fusion protein